MPTQDPSDLPENAEVLIVGAGAAGLYCAYRLLKEGKSKDVVIVERLNRIGGRLDTDLIKVKGADGKVETVRDEEGGMRFTYEMEELMALNGELDLCGEIVDFPMKPTEKGFGLHYFMRGEQFSKTEAAENCNAKWGELYNLAENDREHGKSPGDIITDVYTWIVKENTGKAPPKNPSLTYWQDFRLKYEWKGKPMNKWQLWGLLRDMGYTEECVTMLSHAIGFEGPFLSLANAGEAFQILEDFPENPHYHTFKDGYSTLTKKLREVVEELGGKIFLGVNVESLLPGWNLGLTVAPAGQPSSRFVEGGVSKSISAGSVILAVASKALANLYRSSQILNCAPNAEQIWADIHSVVNMRLLKINLYFDETWWEDAAVVNPPVQYGPSFSDLPINSIYPFYSLAGPEDDKRAGALTIYCDFNNTNFWQGLQNLGPYFDSPEQRAHCQPPQVIFPASIAVVEEALKQIQLVYGATAVPQPVMTSFRIWGGESDFGFAYHQWALNADDCEVMPRMAELVPGLYTCNEAYSDDQGWVNGSLRSANHVLKKFQIDPLPKKLACVNPDS